MNIGIVGSRSWAGNDEVAADVEAVVNRFADDTVVVSGGAIGVDTMAQVAAVKRGLECIVHRPDYASCKTFEEKRRAPLERNTLIVRDCKVLHAWVTADRRGGTEDTIRKANAAGIVVFIHNPTLI